jgi:hypothetical protein
MSVKQMGKLYRDTTFDTRFTRKFPPSPASIPIWFYKRLVLHKQLDKRTIILDTPRGNQRGIDHGAFDETVKLRKGRKKQ